MIVDSGLVTGLFVARISEREAFNEAFKIMPAISDEEYTAKAERERLQAPKKTGVVVQQAGKRHGLFARRKRAIWNGSEN